MATITITITAAGLSVGEMNTKVTDSTKPHEGMAQLENLICAIEGGAIDATVAVAVTTGSSATYNLS